MTPNKPINVKLSLNIFTTAILKRFVIIPISLVKLAMNFPECFLSINFVSAITID